MVVLQAAEAFRRFTGVEPDPDRMLRNFAAADGRPALRAEHARGPE